MTSLVESPLTLARADPGKLELAIAPVDLAAVAKETAAMLRPLAAERAIALSGVPGEGTTFEVRLPREPKPPSDPEV